MEANDFVVRLKANGTEADLFDLHKVFDEYKVILKNLTAKDTGPFSLNVLCILCRNLDKVPTWRDTVDGKTLVSLSLACLDVTHSLPRMDQVKVIACIYHIHKHVVKLNVSISPELILKLSYRPFDDTNSLLAEYCKTYWNILVDRISYVEKLKAKNSISKLLPNIIEDALKVIQMYDTVQFCTNILTFLVKKLYYLYNETNAKELHKRFGDIFKSLSLKSDLASFKKLTNKEILDVYTKFNDCFYVIADNASKTKFENCILNVVVRTAITILGHNVEVMRCLETFFLNGFCSIFENLTNATNIENILTNIVTSSLSIEKLGYEKALYATYPYLNQFLRLFIEISVSNSELDWKIYFNEKIQYGCLNLMLYLSSKKSEQLLKCDNCKVKSGLHDSLRLLFLIKHFPTVSISQNIQINNILPLYYKLVLVQHKILYELKRLGCVNHEKCFRKLQTDIHNTAITLNKANNYDYSIKLFNVYIEFEMKYFRVFNELKNISRALYNKSICELDCKLYFDALKDAFLSLIFSLPDGLGSEKYMSLVIDIKAKSLKGYEGNQDELQLISVLDVCKMCVEEKKYGNLKPFLIDLKFSDLLKHEYSMYAKLWPSIVPIAGVWRSLYDLMKTDVASWVKAENDELIWTLYEVLLDTPSAVRTIHNEYYSEIITELLDLFEQTSAATTELALVQAALLFLKCEYDLADASLKYGWKTTEPIMSMDPDQFQFMRTMPQEHEATKRAIEAVLILTDAVKDIGTVNKSSWLFSALRLYELFVQQLLHLSRTVPAMQLAHNCCEIARHLGDGESFIRTASVLLSHAQESNTDTVRLISECGNRCADVSLQTALRFMADVAIYYSKCGSAGVAARLVQMAQVQILEAHETRPDVNLDLAIGRLTEAQAQLCKGSNALSVASGIQRHYLAITNAETKWSSRRLLALTLKVYISSASLACVRVCRSLLLWRRARCACAACLPAAGAGMGGRLYGAVTNAHRMDDAQTKIDNCLKHILGLQPNETAHSTTEPSKPQFFTPKHENLETMLEDHVFKKTHTSPSLPCTTILAYKTPDFFKHEKCSCFACQNPYSFIIACTTSGLEASMYFRAKEMDIAKNYFEGAIDSFLYAERRIKSYFQSCKAHFEGYVVDMVETLLCDDFRSVQIQVLIEAAFFALSSKEFEVADDWIVRIHEIIQDVTSLDPYLRDDVMNLMTASAQLRKATVKPVETGLELDMECLKLTPDQEPPKTPINKPSMPPKVVRNIVKPEELPIVKRKVIKLNLDDVVEETVKKPTRKRPEFKIPVPVTAKAQLESITPRTRTKPDIIVTSKETGETSDVKMTPKGSVRSKTSDVKEANTFFTPNSTPSEQFFTPMTSMKTYSKKSLRTNIVKNLEAEFSTPKADKENSTLNAEVDKLEAPKTTVRSTRSRVDKQALKRATSPGKLVKEVKPTRSILRNPKFKVHEDTGK